jgi:hypothetical protein
MKSQREATKAVLAAATDADLDAPSDERFRKMVPTTGSVFLLVGTHVLMHVGQFASARRKLHKPVVI